MSIFHRLTCLLLCAILAACASQPLHPGTGHGSQAPLLLISIDSYRPDYLKRGMSPTLAGMAANGVRAVAMQPSFPTLTFPNHYTLVTGLYPDHHGIVANQMFDPRLGTFIYKDHAAVSDGRWWEGAEPIWVTAERHGLATATMFWPGSEAKIHGHRPDHAPRYDGRVTADQRVDQILQWLDLPPLQRPDFLTLYFDRVDHAGHDHGPDSPEVNAAMRMVDAALARLVNGLKARGLYQHMNILVVSDHGMASTPKGQWIVMDDLIDLEHVRVVSLGTLAGFIPQPRFAAAVKAVLLAPHAHMRCWNKADIPARLHYGSNPRVPPLVCSAQVGWQITSRASMAARTKPMNLGQHGYDNADPSMRALFVAHGPAFRQDIVVPEFPNVDVYPLMAHLLHIHGLPNDGDFATVRGMLKP